MNKRLGLLVMALALAGAVLARAQTKPANVSSEELTLPTDTELLKQYRMQTQYVSKLKLESKYHTISDLIQTRVEEGLIVMTGVASANQQVRVELDDMPGVASYAGSRGASGFIQLTIISPNQNGYAQSNVSGSSGNFSVHVTEFTSALQTTTSFSQNSQRGAGMGPTSVSFTIYRTDRRAGSMRDQKNYQGTNLEDLRRKNPGCEDDLRKLLARFGQEHLLAADPKLAWQVFALDAQPRPEIVQQVADLVKQLDANDSKARDEAVVKLKSLGAPGMLALVRVDRKGLSLEQQFRLESAMEPYAGLPADAAKARRSDLMFLLDCLMCKDPGIPPLALARLKELTGKPIEFKTDAPLNDRIKAVTAIRQEIGKTAASPAGK